MAADLQSTVAMDYLLFDTGPFGFPAPRVPITAPLRRGALRGWGRPDDALPAWGPKPRFYSRARYALRDAFALSGVGPGGGALVPAYHCRTMLDPALALGAPVALYAIETDLSVNVADVARLLTRARQPIKAVLAPHFYGQAQDLGELAALCHQHGAALIEDCAHALPLRSPSNGMGRTGDYCIASPYKFFPCEDGGVLWRGDGQPLPPLPALRRPSLRTELGQWRSLQAKGRMRPPSPRFAPEQGELAPLTAAERNAQQVAVRQPGCSTDYLAAREGLACSRLSQWLIGQADVAALLARRRSHYQRWVQAVQGLPHATALRPQLGASDTPYMFALQLSQPGRHFAALKRAGLPMWRWDNLAASDCAVSAGYRLALVQLPCHQGLSDSDLNWMASVLHSVLTADSPERIAGGAP